MLSINPKNINKVTRRELPHCLILQPGENEIISPRLGQAEAWCLDNLGTPAITPLAQTHSDASKGFCAFTYHGRWVRVGTKFRFRTLTDATAFKMVWC